MKDLLDDSWIGRSNRPLGLALVVQASELVEDDVDWRAAGLDVELGGRHGWVGGGDGGGGDVVVVVGGDDGDDCG